MAVGVWSSVVRVWWCFVLSLFLLLCLSFFFFPPPFVLTHTDRLAPMARTLLGGLGHATLNFFVVAARLLWAFCVCPKFCDLAKQRRKTFWEVSEVAKNGISVCFCRLCVFFLFLFFPAAITQRRRIGQITYDFTGSSPAITELPHNWSPDRRSTKSLHQINRPFEFAAAMSTPVPETSNSA